MSKTRKNRNMKSGIKYNRYNSYNKSRKNSIKGGHVLASGGFGCVFSPALRCAGESKRNQNMITKLMTEKHAIDEYKEINDIKLKLDTIPNYSDYFLIDNLTLCKPATLLKTDLEDYNAKCRALPKDNITRKNINDNLEKLVALNMPNGGIPVDDYIYETNSLEKIYKLHEHLLDMLKNGIVPMNAKNVYHCDIKDSNVLVDTRDSTLKTRLIDWGLSTVYTPFKRAPFPKSWRNRPLQFNVPFSVIIFSDSFIEKYTKFLKDGGKRDETGLKMFVIDYVTFWMKKRGAGHYKFINEIMLILFGNDITSVSERNKPTIIETQVTMNYIVDYIVDVLLHYTKIKKDGTVDLREYLDNVFIKIVDIWGYMCVYLPIVELFSKNYRVLNKNEMTIFNMLQYMFVEYLYSPRHEPVDMNELYTDLQDLGKLLRATFSNKSEQKREETLDEHLEEHLEEKLEEKNNISDNILAKGIKTRNSTSNILFKRPTKKRKFKNPIFLSLK